MKGILFLLKLLLKIVAAPVILVLTLFVWFCAGLVYISGLVLGLVSMVLGLLGVAVLITYSPFWSAPTDCPWQPFGCWERYRI